MKKSYLQLLSLALIVLFLGSCDSIGNSWKGGTTKGSATKEIKDPSKLTIVLSHGLSDTPDSLGYMKEYLKKKLPGAQILTPAEEETASKSINEQSKSLADFIEKNANKGNSIFMVGHSQGGLRQQPAGIALQEKGRDIAGFITIGTPLKGIHVLSAIVNHSSKYESQLETIGQHIPFLHNILKQIENNASGILDMLPNSPFLKEIHSQLENNSIPKLAVGGDMSTAIKNLADAVKGHNPETSPILEATLNNLDMLIGHPKHDLLIQLSSQLAEGIQAKNFERASFSATTHFPLTEYISNLQLGSTVNALLLPELRSDEIIDKVVEFIGKHSA